MARSISQPTVSRTAATSPDELLSDAAQYAIGRAVNAREFFDLFQTYVTLVTSRGLTKTSPPQRETEISGSLEALRRSLYSHLDCLTADPRLDGFDARDAVFLDIEASGLEHGAGTYAFLIGLAWLEGDVAFVE